MFDMDMYNRPQPGRMPQQPYGYDMNNTLPTSMGVDNSAIPALYPSMMTPNLSKQAFMPSGGDSGGRPTYKRGGRIRRYAPGGHIAAEPRSMLSQFVPGHVERQEKRRFIENYSPQERHGMTRNQKYDVFMARQAPEPYAGRAERFTNPNEAIPYANEYNESNIKPSAIKHINAPYAGGAAAYRGMPPRFPEADPRRAEQRRSNLLALSPYNKLTRFASSHPFNQDSGIQGHRYVQEPLYAPPPMQEADIASGSENYYMGPEGTSFRRRYAEGGHASLAMLAEHLREKGEGPDKVLAYIDPYEAMQLEEQSGAPTMNPETHLPQYGFLKGAGKLFKKAIGIAAPFIGGAIAGPAGAAIGGGLGGAIAGGKKNMLRNAVLGGALGYAGSGGFGNLGGLGKVIPGVNQGVAGLFQGKGAGGFSGLGSIFGGGAPSTGPSKGGGLGDIFKGMSALDKILLGTAAIGMVGGKRKAPQEQNLMEYVNAQGPRGSAGAADRQVKPTERVRRILQNSDNEGVPEELYFEDANPAVQYMAHGGYLDGDSGGQDDTIPAALSDGEYVISADVVSNLGDGNNRKGAKKLDGLMRNVRTHKYKKGGRGLPPKAKSLGSYMKMRSA